MTDYKKLIKTLRKMSKAIIREDAKFVGIPEEDIWDADANVLDDAANAIGQLAADYEILAEIYAKVSEELCIRTKERDEARAALQEATICDYCKWYINYDCTDFKHDECHGEHWEQREVRETMRDV